MKKRILSLLLAVVMIVGMLPTVALAAQTGDNAPATGPKTVVVHEEKDDPIHIVKSVSGDTLTLEAYVTNPLRIVTDTVPLDIALVLDVSGSMKETIKTRSYEAVYDLVGWEYYYRTENGSYERAYHCDGWHRGFHGTTYKAHEAGWFTSYYGNHTNDNRLTPKTSATDKDTLHTQFYRRVETEQSKISILRDAVNGFIDNVAETSPNSSIALVKFAGVKNEEIGNGTYTAEYNGNKQKNTNFTQIVKTLTQVNTPENAKALKDAVAALNPEGMTHTDYAMDKAEEALNGSDRQKVVIVFTDGEPSEWSGYNGRVAAGAVNKAKSLKKGGTLVYTIAVAENADADKTDGQINKFLHAVSSNYPDATATESSITLNTRAPSGNYYRVAKKGGELIDIFEQLSKEVSSLTLNMGESTVLSDTLSQYFTFKNEEDSTYGVRVYTADAVKNQTALAWEDAVEFKDAKLDVDPSTKTITVKNFDYGKNAVTIDTDEMIISGKKLIVEIPITPDKAYTDWKAGTENYPTNDTDKNKAGLSGYTDEKNNPLTTKLDESPEVPVTAYTVTYESTGANSADGKPASPADPEDDRTKAGKGYIPGQTVTVKPALEADGWDFYGWSALGITFTDKDGTKTFTMSDRDVKLTGTWTKTPTTANVTITKTFSGAEAPTDFALSLKKNGGDGTELLEKADDSYTYTAELEEGEYTLTESGADVDGKTLTATLKQGDTVIEPNNGAWTITIGKNDLDANLAYTLTNTYADYAPARLDLSTLFEKTLTGKDLADLPDSLKTFTVKLTPGTKDDATGSYTWGTTGIITGTATCGDDGATVNFGNFNADGPAQSDVALSGSELVITPEEFLDEGAFWYYLVEEVIPTGENGVASYPGLTYDTNKYILAIWVSTDSINHKYDVPNGAAFYPYNEETGAGKKLANRFITFNNTYTKPASTAEKHVITYERAIPEEIRKTLGHVDYPEWVNNDKTQLVVDKSVDTITLAYEVYVDGGIGAYATVSDPGATYVGYAVKMGDAIVTGGWGDGVMIQFLDDDTTVVLYYTKTFTRGKDGTFATAQNIAVVNGNDVPSEETTITDKTPGGLDFSDIIWKDLYVTGDQNFPESLTFRAELKLVDFDAGAVPQIASGQIAVQSLTEDNEPVEAFPEGWSDTLYATFYPDDVKFDKHNTKRFTAQDGSHLFLEFPAEGQYIFRVEEINDKEDGVKYDSHVYEIVVLVLTGEDGVSLEVVQYSLAEIINDDEDWFEEDVDKITFYNEVDTGDIPYYPIIPTIIAKDDGKLNKTDHFAYIIGYPDGTVHPNGEITRAEVATIFFRLLKDDVRNAYFTSYNTYSDVQLGKWYNNPISTMSALGIINGYPDGTFRPNAPITRAEFAAIAARFDETATRGTTTFVDVYGHWAADEIAKAYGNDWIKGYPDGTFRPDRNITRAEAMALINRVLDRAPESPSDLLPDMNKWSDNMDTTKWYYLDIQEATNSHDYTRKTFNYELWKRMLLDPDWSRYER